jgi:hypothetical protein
MCFYLAVIRPSFLCLLAKIRPAIRFVDVTRDVVSETSGPTHEDAAVVDAAQMASSTNVRDASGSQQSPTTALSIPADSVSFSPPVSLPAVPTEPVNSAWAFELGVFDHGSAFNPSLGIGDPLAFRTDLSPTLQFQNLPDATSQSVHTVAPRPQSHCLNLKEAELVRHYADHLAPWVWQSS